MDFFYLDPAVTSRAVKNFSSHSKSSASGPWTPAILCSLHILRTDWSPLRVSCSQYHIVNNQATWRKRPTSVSSHVKESSSPIWFSTSILTSLWESGISNHNHNVNHILTHPRCSSVQNLLCLCNISLELFNFILQVQVLLPKDSAAPFDTLWM